MRIGLYGMPTAGKSYILDKIHFINTVSGSKELREICQDFDTKDEVEKRAVRQKLANSLSGKNGFIMDGHYSFGDTVVFTENDGRLYDTFIYLYLSPSELVKRMKQSEKNRKYLIYDIDSWQKKEIESLRNYCHENEKDFYVVDNPPENVFDDISFVIEFIKDITEGYSCVSFAKECAERIVDQSKSDRIVLMDGDMTITLEDTSRAVFGYSTNIYDNNFYTGYQSWEQSREFESYNFEDLTKMPVLVNKGITKYITDDTFILTSGHDRIWRFISREMGLQFFCGAEMSAETKLYITKRLQKSGKTVTAYGDAMNDYYMLRQANRGFLVKRKNGALSRSLKDRDLEGLVSV